MVADVGVVLDNQLFVSPQVIALLRGRFDVTDTSVYILSAGQL